GWAKARERCAHRPSASASDWWARFALPTLQLHGSRRLGDHAVAAVVLGAVERVVGALEHVGDRLALLLQRRDADRDRHLDPPGALVDGKGLARDRAAKALGHHARDMQVGFRHHDHEFLAPIATGQIDATDRLADPYGEFAQHVVAGVVA